MALPIGTTLSRRAHGLVAVLASTDAFVALYTAFTLSSLGVPQDVTTVLLVSVLYGLGLASCLEIARSLNASYRGRPLGAGRFKGLRLALCLLVLLMPSGLLVVEGVERAEDSWMWLTIPVATGAHTVHVELVPSGDGPTWRGSAATWLITMERPQPYRVELELVDPGSAPRPMPPSPWPAGTLKRTTELGTVAFGD